MTAGTQASHQTIPNVDPGRDAQSISGFDCAGSGKKPIDSELALKWLKSVLRPSSGRGCDCSAKRQHDGNQPRLKHP